MIGPISRAHVSVEEAREGCALACRAAPATDLELEVVGKFQKPFYAGARKAPVVDFNK